MPRPGVLGSAEFGVIVDSPDVTRVHVFRGLVRTRLVGGGPSGAMAVPLVANRSLLLARDGSRGVATLARRPGWATCSLPAAPSCHWTANGSNWRGSTRSAAARSEHLSPSAAAKTSSCRRSGHRRERPQIRPRRQAVSDLSPPRGTLQRHRLHLPAHLRSGRPEPGHRHAAVPTTLPATALPRSGSTARASAAARRPRPRPPPRRKKPASSSLMGACGRVISSPEPTCSRST